MFKRHDCLNDCWDLRKTVLDLTQLQENRIRNLELALQDADIPIPHGRAERERKESQARGLEILFPEGVPEVFRDHG
jgi:hypothetical protein